VLLESSISLMKEDEADRETYLTLNRIKTESDSQH